jgi:hypothetical protein
MEVKYIFFPRCPLCSEYFDGNNNGEQSSSGMDVSIKFFVDNNKIFVL